MYRSHCLIPSPPQKKEKKTLPKLHGNRAASAMKCFPFLQGLFQLAGAVHGPLEFSIAKREAVQLPVDKLRQFLILHRVFLGCKVAGPTVAHDLCIEHWKKSRTCWKFEDQR